MTNLVYFGSPAFSAKILSSLSVHIVAVVTQPDKPLGRKQVLTPSPVAQLASKYDLPTFKPERLDETNLAHLKLLKPDIFLVVSYGKIIPKNWLTTPTIGTFNLHFSLLPKYRGALCISEAIKNQDSQTGVTLMIMDEGVDTGPIISQEKVGIDINDNCETLTNKLTQAGIKLLKSLPACMRSLRRGQISHPQDETLASYTPTTKTRNRQSAFIPWDDIQRAMSNEQYALTTHALIRSLNPDPGAWTKIGDLEIKIIRTSLATKGLILDTIQLPGKTPISWKQFQSRTNPPQDVI